MNTDSVAEFLTSIRNATRARHKKVDVAASRLRLSLAEILKKSGFIKNYKLFKQDNKGVLRLYLKYIGKGEPVIHGLKRVSRPSRRVYLSYDKLPTVLGGIGVAVVSTSKGMLTDEQARTTKVGGELICTVW